MKNFIALAAILMLSPVVFAQNSAFVREVDLEQARAKDFRHHEVQAEEYERERESHVDKYKEKVVREAETQEKAREAYVIERDRREKGLSDEQLDEILHRKAEREAARYEAERESFVHLRDQIEDAHHHAQLNENEEYGL